MKTLKEMLKQLENKKQFKYAYQAVPGVDEQAWLKLLFSSYPFEILAVPVREDKNLRKKFRLNPSPKVVSKAHLVKFTAKEFPKNICMWRAYAESWFGGLRGELEALQELSDEEIRGELEEENLLTLLAYIFFCQREEMYEYFRDKLPEALELECYQSLFGEEAGKNDDAQAGDEAVVNQAEDTSLNGSCSECGIAEEVKKVLYRHAETVAADIADILGSDVHRQKELSDEVAELRDKNKELKQRLKTKKGELKAREKELIEAGKQLKAVREKEMTEINERLEQNARELKKKN